MSHNHDHDHSHEGHAGHSHSHIPQIKSLNKAFVIGIILNLAYVVVQLAVGLSIHSLSLLSDAGHNFLDVAGLALAMLAFKLSKSKSTETFTYGHKKASILISLFNAAVLLLSIGAIGYESIFRFSKPEVLPGFTIAIIAVIGIVINTVSAFMFFREKDKDINVKSAFLHLAADAMVSMGLVIGGIVIHYTHLYWIDPLLSVIICLVIIASTWKLLSNSFRLSMDGVPDNIDLQKVKEAVLKVEGVSEMHHLHIWAISTTENALTTHIKVCEDATMPEIEIIKRKVKHTLQHLNINHATLEIEVEHCGEV